MKSITLELLTSPGCVHCHEFLKYWSDEAKHWPNVKFTEISIITPEGQALVGKHQIFASPGIIMNDELFDSGGFNKSELTEKLKQLSI